MSKKNATAIVLFSLISLVNLFGAPPAHSQVKVSSIFSDNLVLQANADARIYGTAQPGEPVTARFAGREFRTSTDKVGRWSIPLGALKTGVKGDLVLQGTNVVTIKNVIVGEVWLCAGQSNMALPVQKSTSANEILKHPLSNEIRFLVIPPDMANHPAPEVCARWMVCDKHSLPGVSALAYLFARDLAGSLHSPVGIVQAAYGGSSIKTWLSKDAVTADQTLATSLRIEPNSPAYFMQFAINKDEKEQRARHQSNQSKDQSEATNHHVKLAASFDQPLVPFSLFNAMIAPLTGFCVSGIAWYQGEADAEDATLYRKLFPALIADWRKHWHSASLPFVFVQLPNFEISKYCTPGKNSWAALRDAQTQALRLPGTAMTVAIDQGDAHDLHPARKDVVAQRLALSALALKYKRRDVQSSGPILDRITRENSTLVCHFRCAGGLHAKNGALTGFEICSADGKYVAAEAAVKKDTVLVKSKSVSAPSGVAYGWANNPHCNLYNDQDLPAAPFRADTDGDSTKSGRSR